jgi:RNase P subunit RPR2
MCIERHRSLRVRLGLLATLAAAEPAAAEPLYIQRAESARPNAEAIAKARQPVREHRDIAIREDLKVPPFHKRLDDPVRDGETFCQDCHLPLPHTKSLRSRSFLNMHSRSIACETCHFQPKDAAIAYRWLDYRTGQPAKVEARFRTGRKADNAAPLGGGVKIAPFAAGTPAIALPGSDFAIRIAREWKNGDEAARAQLKARLHAPLAKEGPACARCHTETKPLLDLAALAAPPEQATAILRHVIPQFFARYKDEDERLKIIDILR